MINALKHAFPGERGGAIVVRYRSRLADWNLSVSDDGVGMVKRPATAKGGLGTSIVEALAKQLDAKVTVSAANPGTVIAIAHGSGRAAAGALIRPRLA